MLKCKILPFQIPNHSNYRQEFDKLDEIEDMVNGWLEQHPQCEISQVSALMGVPTKEFGIFCLMIFYREKQVAL